MLLRASLPSIKDGGYGYKDALREYFDIVELPCRIACDASGSLNIKGRDAEARQRAETQISEPPKAGCCGLGWKGDEKACGGKACVWWNSGELCGQIPMLCTG